MVLTHLPALKTPVVVTTLQPTGQWVDNDNWGDGHIIHEGGRLHIMHRSGRGFTPGLQYNSKAFDGDPTKGYGLITPSLSSPSKAIEGGGANGHAVNATNVDTPTLVRNPHTGVYTCIANAKPGALPVGTFGFVKAVQRWTSTSPGRTTDQWTGYDDEFVIEPDAVNAPWTAPRFNLEGSAINYDSGIDEASIVYEPDTDEFIIFFEAESYVEAANSFGTTFRQYLGRATCPAAIFDSAPVFTWTPDKSATSYVWEPRENGADGDYGGENSNALWGTSQDIPLRSCVTRWSDGSYHMVMIQSKPNTNQAAENITTGIGHWYSLNKGVKGSWIADKNNPLITFNSIRAIDPLGGPWNTGTGTTPNKLNSPFLLQIGSKGWLFFWGNGNPQNLEEPIGINDEGTALYAMELSGLGGDRKRRRRGQVYRSRRPPSVIPLTLEEQRQSGVIGIRPPHKR